MCLASVQHKAVTIQVEYNHTPRGLVLPFSTTIVENMSQLIEEETDDSTLHMSPSVHTNINVEDNGDRARTTESDNDIKPDADELHYNASLSTAEYSNNNALVQDSMGRRSNFGGLKEPKLDIVCGQESGEGDNISHSEHASHEEMTHTQTPHPQLVMAHSPFCESEARQWHAVTVYDENTKDASQQKDSAVDQSQIASSSNTADNNTAENLPSKAGRIHNFQFHIFLSVQYTSL